MAHCMVPFHEKLLSATMTICFELVNMRFYRQLREGVIPIQFGCYIFVQKTFFPSFRNGKREERQEGRPKGKVLLLFTNKNKQLHYQNKLVALTTEWLPWLQTRWRDSSSERFTVVCKTNCIKQPRGICPVHLTQPQYTDNPQNIHVCEEVFTRAPQCFEGWFSVCGGCKMNWAAASHVTLCNQSSIEKINLS